MISLYSDMESILLQILLSLTVKELETKNCLRLWQIGRRFEEADGARWITKNWIANNWISKNRISLNKNEWRMLGYNVWFHISRLFLWKWSDSDWMMLWYKAWKNVVGSWECRWNNVVSTIRKKVFDDTVFSYIFQNIKKSITQFNRYTSSTRPHCFPAD